MKKMITLKIKECSSVALALVIGIFGLIIVFNSGCTSKEEKIKIEENKLEIQNVKKMIDKWNAIENWEEELLGDGYNIGGFYTAELQDRFLRKDTKPFFFVIGLKDIEKIGDDLYLGYFELKDVVEVEIFLELSCNESQLKKLISSPKNRFWPELFGVVAEVEDVRSSRYITQDLNEGRYQIDIELTPIVRGVCLDLVHLDQFYSSYGFYEEYKRIEEDD